MNHSKIAVRYAKALFLTATETNRLEEQTKDIRFLDTFMKTTSEFGWLINSPVIANSAKEKIFTKVFSGSVGADTLRFLQLLLNNNRESHLPAICRNYLDVYRGSKGIQSAHFQTAVEMDEATLVQVKKIAESYFSTIVELFPESDPALIGGFVLRVGDKQIDSSVSTKLEKLRRGLINGDYNGKI